jgi:CTD kinase subunit gamma
MESLSITLMTCVHVLGLVLTRIQVLQGLQEKDFLDTQTVADIEDALKDREQTVDDLALASPVHGDNDINMAPSQTIPKPTKSGSQQRLDKRQIEQRIEEDRERHKRQRESIWMIPIGPNAERDRMFDEASELGEDDFQLGVEENEERERCWLQSCPHAYAEKYGKPFHMNGSSSGSSTKST